jgi:PhzF family phenazine biosynthesis protein
MTSQIIYQVDAFTTEAFKGNPAGVCLLDKEPAAQWMQNIAMEMNLSETAFVYPKDGLRIIRFFTPAKEVDLCGHATLSASHILFEQGFVKHGEEINYSSKAGILNVIEAGGWITMNFPVYKLTGIDQYEMFKTVTGKEALELYTTESHWSLALLRNEKDVATIEPDFRLMKNSVFGDLVATAVSDNPDFDFCVRCFAPVVGIDEDPVTGSANCILAPFWSGKLKKNSFMSHQISRREGILKVSLVGDRVEISGHAKTIFKAGLLI